MLNLTYFQTAKSMITSLSVVQLLYPQVNFYVIATTEKITSLLHKCQFIHHSRILSTHKITKVKLLYVCNVAGELNYFWFLSFHLKLFLNMNSLLNIYSQIYFVVSNQIHLQGNDVTFPRSLFKVTLLYKIYHSLACIAN